MKYIYAFLLVLLLAFQIDCRKRRRSHAPEVIPNRSHDDLGPKTGKGDGEKKGPPRNLGETCKENNVQKSCKFGLECREVLNTQKWTCQDPKAVLKTGLATLDVKKRRRHH